MYSSLLVPTDGSEHAARAAEHAAVIADAFDAALHVVAVVDLDAASGVFDAGGIDPAFVDRLEAAAEDAIATVEAAVGAPVIDHDAVVRGRPADAIAEYARAHGVDAIAMGTQGRSGVRRFVAGSVTEGVLRLVDVPVLTVRGTDRDGGVDAYGEVLVPTDGGPVAAAAADHALAIAGRFDARVHAVHVIETGALSRSVLASDVLTDLETAGEAATAEIADRAAAADLEARTAVLEGRAGDAITAYAAENAVDLIVMGTAGRSGVDRALLGSTAERVVRRADAPVMAVPPRDDP